MTPLALVTMDAAAPRRAIAWFPWLGAVVGMLPLLWCRADFRDLFWFGDEWDQLDQISRLGFGRWILGAFGENFAPLLKLSWGSLVLATQGSYFAMICAVWAFHLLTVALFGRWLLQQGFGWTSAAAVVGVFALASTNVETLAWSIQLITIQGMLFFVAAGQWLGAMERDGSWGAGRIGILMLLVTGSAFSFVRGPLVGGVLAVLALWPLLACRASPHAWRRRVVVAAACLIPAATCAALIAAFAGGNHQRLASSGLEAPARYAAAYFLLNPLHNLMGAREGGGWLLAAGGAAKLGALALGWRLASPAQRRVLLPLLLFDGLNALLLGLGRHDTGLATATSSRYQYISLLCTLPFGGVLLEALLQRLPRNARLIAASATIVALAFGAARPWPRVMQEWAGWRGRQTRDVLFHTPDPPAENAIPGIPFLTTTRARELVSEYNLH